MGEIVDLQMISLTLRHVHVEVLDTEEIAIDILNVSLLVIYIVTFYKESWQINNFVND